MNAGSIDMLEQIGEQKAGHPVWLRINPGFGHGHSQKLILAAKIVSTVFGMKTYL